MSDHRPIGQISRTRMAGPPSHQGRGKRKRPEDAAAGGPPAKRGPGKPKGKLKKKVRLQQHSQTYCGLQAAEQGTTRHTWESAGVSRPSGVLAPSCAWSCACELPES